MSLIYGVLRQINKMRTILVNKRRQGIFWTLFLEFKNREGGIAGFAQLGKLLSPRVQDARN